MLIAYYICFKALVLGQQGIEMVLDILKTELIRGMQLAETASIEKISRNHISTT
ncbi:hypothetical protein [Flavivirga spongiicola]|uniref:Alpha-hydroxy-acid oxidizing protein n=1 Tax=Flavivirga spongiicola TaxID=421621 RepID=A0ABU7XWY8_9FLAO|nr:hypothetical protein [Flavivirga sp. MEBiC05379]MDO5980286.1 hypothetical protein [Flavivirga sp. MEBiC05379]